ncbi:hypothetical protein FS837_004220 [Tulasnella sp. UAMH 9824]|nr:hypothetical protein FS837_004220 [Tulasnella sp. UAMH 9824]
MTTPGPKLASKPVDLLTRLPAELLMTIAHFYLLLSGEHDEDLLAVFPLTWVNRRLRHVVVGTPELWTSFRITEDESTFHVARLCIERSRAYPLDDSIYMIKDGAFLDAGKSVLARLEMPALEEIGLHHDRLYEYHGFRIRGIEILGGGANIQTLTLRGLFPIGSNLSSLKSLTPISPWYCRWTPALISTLITESPSLENPTFMGTEAAFNVEGDLTLSVLSSPSLRYLATDWRITFTFTARLLLALHAPSLETVHITTPLLRVDKRIAGTPVGWEEIVELMEDRFLTRKDTFGQVHSLVLDPYWSGTSPRRNWVFFRFLMAAFPRINSLDLDQKDIELLSICNGKNDLLEAGGTSINQLTIRGNASHLVLDHLFAFVHVRNSNGRNKVEGGSVDEVRGEGGDDDEDDETKEDQHEESQDAGEDAESRGKLGHDGEEEMTEM